MSEPATVPSLSTDQRRQYEPRRPFISICPFVSREACPRGASCASVHFERVVRPHTELALGDCSYLNTCHRMDSCRYVHWKLEDPGSECAPVKEVANLHDHRRPAQWVNVDLRTFDLSVLGHFDIVLADPPWAIHQELPYGTLTDTQLLSLAVSSIQKPGGLLFLWVTGRAMELGRNCLDAWGYERIDEIVWVKTNVLGGLIRTGRTGHWLNHSKEHCLVAVRKSPDGTVAIPDKYKRGLDTQVLLSEVRETSRKPDELYEMIERMLGYGFPGDEKLQPRMVELFGRAHNVRDGWFTVGNQLERANKVTEPSVIEAWNKRYPDDLLAAPTNGESEET